MIGVEPIPVQMFGLGYADLVSVIPPNASLTPGSKIQPAGLGKTPGRRTSNGTWSGFGGWQTYPTAEADVRQWVLDGANIGLRGDHFPAIDIDCTDPRLSEEIASIAQNFLGPAPVRIGRAPKQLLMYRIEGDPFHRMAVEITVNEDEHHLVEALGVGRQYLIYGTHPSGKLYAWTDGYGPDRIDPALLTAVSRERVTAFFLELKRHLEAIPGFSVKLIGDGLPRETKGQDTLKAPSLDLLEEAVGMVPNDNEMFGTRDDYLKIGYAIKAAGQDDEERAYQCYLNWALKWEGNQRFPEGNNPDTVLADWRRMVPPFAVGWGWIGELAARFGFNMAGTEFDTVEDAVERQAERDAAPRYSHQWLADKVIAAEGDHLRFVPATGKWHVWDGSRWATDAVMAAEHTVSRVLRDIGIDLARMGATAAEKAAFMSMAKTVCSSPTAAHVRTQMESDPRIATAPEAFDSDPMLLNTPGGIVNLATAELTPPDPAKLLTKMTSVTPDFNADCPTYKKFLLEACGGDVALMRYFQRVDGYCLTGLTREQKIWMVFGGGGNGKSVKTNATMNIMGSYAMVAPMDTFTASKNERHSTELAGMMGARLVLASETKAGGRWDEARLKQLSGGESISARFLFKDFISFVPQFKLMFVGNHKPEIKDVDAAMIRRIHLIPFENVPAVVDMHLAEKLRAEYPAILAWMIVGCMDWQTRGLEAPESVRLASHEYVEEQDAVGQWAQECLKPASETDAFVSSNDLFNSWREWCGQRNQYAGTQRTLTERLKNKRIGSYSRDLATRTVRGFRGLELIPVNWS
jgi:P4 family phage/plasmid primase-like protien